MLSSQHLVQFLYRADKILAVHVDNTNSSIKFNLRRLTNIDAFVAPSYHRSVAYN
jgi:hypothetical protein